MRGDAYRVNPRRGYIKLGGASFVQKKKSKRERDIALNDTLIGGKSNGQETFYISDQIGL